jgi:hypothetical protein
MEIDCTQEHPSERYFSTGDVKVVEGAAGRYREAAGKPLSRFGYRFRVEHLGQPHLAVIRYPDDKRRFMCVMDGTCYDLSTGVTTGFAYPLSGRMREIRQVFWPRWHDCTLVFMTWGHGEPAAVASIAISELDSLPALDGPAPFSGGARRELGIQYEDPCGTAASEGALSKAEWVERVITYARHTGQRLLTYPLVWYHGPQYPSAGEPADAFDVVVAPDRKQYVRWTSRPPEWIGPLLRRFEEEGMGFVGALTLLRLGSLMRQMNTDLAAIQAGAETINNLLWCDQVQAGTMDWTPVYNVRNYPEITAKGLGVQVMKDFPYAYGEKTQQPYHAGPIFNPLHPIVQQAVRAVVRELASTYGPYKAFKGLSLNFWAPTIVWFGSIHSGYDDYSARLFEQETGIAIPVAPKDPQRFSKRYEYLTFRCKPAWVAWRCRKIHQLLCALRDELVAVRPDLRLILTLWSEPYLPQIIGNGRASNQLYARPSTLEFYREAGFDPALYQNEPNLEADFQFEGGGRDRSDGNRENAPLESFFMFRDHDYLDRDTLAAWSCLPRPGVFIFNAWHEAWGKHRWFPGAADDPQQAGLAVMSAQPAEGIFRINSEYPQDGFWFESQLRITHAFPPAEHFLEPYAQAVAELDACRITRGGLFLDKAHSRELRSFAAAYQSLPAESFGTVGAVTDPVAVRTLVPEHEPRRYVYLVNRGFYPVRVRVSLSQAATLLELATAAQVEAPADWTVDLQPYELRSFTTDPTVQLSGFAVEVPEEIVDGFRRETQRALEALATACRTGHCIAGSERIENDLRQCLAEGRFARLQHLLTGYHVCKCRDWASLAG